MTLGELIAALGGKLVQGSEETEVAGVAASGVAREMDLVFAEDAASAAKALGGAAGAVVLKAGSLTAYDANPAMAVVEADQPRLWFARAAKLMKPPPARGVCASFGVDQCLCGTWDGRECGRRCGDRRRRADWRGYAD